MSVLPVDPLVPLIVEHVRAGRNLVLTAAPGAGKTTRVPPALLGAVPGEVLVLEPRRLAARLVAARVAAERGEPLGQTVGYQVRFEQVGGRHTRLRFLTEGVLVRRLRRDASLRGVDCVVLDEFHERHLDTDAAFALLRRLQQTSRPDLRLVIMSATIAAEQVAAALGGCPILHAAGRVFPVQTLHLPGSALPLEEQVAGAAAQALSLQREGDLLVFLPGAGEIRRALRACEPVAARHGLELLPLYGELPPAEQDRAVQPGGRRKLICSTNVAESSVTIPGVRAVIDSGLARRLEHSPWTGLSRLAVGKVSQASAKQRAGRAGRTGPGTVIRLYPEEDFVRRAAYETPEILRQELSGLVLELLAMGIPAAVLPWLEAPPAAAIEAAHGLLERLGALDGGQLTPTGRAMAGFALHPRLARVMVAAGPAAWHAAPLAAALSLGERLNADRHATGPSDAFALAEQPGTDARRRLIAQLRDGLSRRAQFDEPALLKALLAGFPDRAGRRRSKGSNEIVLAGGGAATLAVESVVREAEFLLALEVDQRPERGRLIRLASAIEPDWLLDLCPERVEVVDRREWNARDGRVEQVSGLRYDGLVIEESRSGAPADAETARVLVEQAMAQGWERLVDAGQLADLRARLAFASQHSAAVPPLDEDLVRKALQELADGARSLGELDSAARSGFAAAVLRSLGPAGTRALDAIAPERLLLPSGRQARIHYSEHQAPHVASRLQDFFGLKETPRVANGAVPLVVHLLAPNQRPVQMTTDLAGFWQRLYPQVRKELSRRYPRHQWPETV